jgi:hypothetical protein
MNRFLILLLSLVSLPVLAQNGNVEIIKDERIENLVKQKGAIIPPATSPQISGFRVQLIFDSNKKSIDDARSRFVSMNPKIDTYITYNAPNFVLKVGDFRTKQEADKVKDGLMRDFPTCFVVKEMINLPRID